MTRIIVGVDGSENGTVALRWAADRAARHGGEVVAILAWNSYYQGHRVSPEDVPSDFGDEDAVRVLDEAVEAAGVNGDIVKQTPKAPAPEALVEATDPDDLIVVGARGSGGFEGLLLGSVSQWVLELSPCPVVVIHGARTVATGGDVVVGVDGSECSMRALRWAASEASAAGVALRIVHAWPERAAERGVAPQSLEILHERAAELVAKVAEDPSLDGLTVERDVVYGSPAKALLAHDADASLFVLASRGQRKAKGFLLGSTSRQVAQHATAPVVVVPCVE